MGSANFIWQEHVFFLEKFRPIDPEYFQLRQRKTWIGNEFLAVLVDRIIPPHRAPQPQRLRLGSTFQAPEYTSQDVGGVFLTLPQFWPSPIHVRSAEN